MNGRNNQTTAEIGKRFSGMQLFTNEDKEGASHNHGESGLLVGTSIRGQPQKGRFTVSEEWLCTGEGKGPISGDPKKAKGRDDELVVSVPLMISCSTLVEGADMIVTASKGGRPGNDKYRRIDAWFYSMLTDLFLVYYQGMSICGRADIAGQATVTMLSSMKRHPLYDGRSGRADAGD